MIISTILSTAINQGIRFIKGRILGSNVETALSLSLPGLDFVPPKDMQAIYVKTANSESPVFVGYINTAIISDLKVGEAALYSYEGDTSKATIKAKISGDIEINGNSDNLVRFSSLKTGLQSQDSDINIELNKIAAAINAIAPGSYTPTLISTDVDSAKVEDVKTN